MTIITIMIKLTARCPPVLCRVAGVGDKGVSVTVSGVSDDSRCIMTPGERSS